MKLIVNKSNQSTILNFTEGVLIPSVGCCCLCSCSCSCSAATVSGKAVRPYDSTAQHASAEGEG